MSNDGLQESVDLICGSDFIGNGQEFSFQPPALSWRSVLEIGIGCSPELTASIVACAYTIKLKAES
jgi:hypothetical protein